MIDYNYCLKRKIDPNVPRMCSKTVLDASTEGITFDSDGVCNFVRQAEWRLDHERFLGQEREKRLAGLVETIKASGVGKEYDCIIGLSGGVDSSCVAAQVVGLGLRPLAIHLDNGWNSELAVANIERIITKLGIDLITYVVDWDEIKDLQRAYFKASVLDLECVSDHAINTILLREASRRGIRYLLHGGNVATESILPTAWGYDKRDGKNLWSIHKKFGTRRLKTYPYMFPRKLFYYLFVRGIRAIPILNYVEYNKTEAVKSLQTDFDWRPYGRKHGENRFTRFFQEYYLPVKFNIDKRRAHLSSMIVSGEISRDEAIKQLEEPLYERNELEEDFRYVAGKLDFEPSELSALISRAPVRHTEYGNAAWMFDHSSKWVQLARYIAKGEFSLKRIRSVWAKPSYGSDQ
ncbi:MAG: N-acetyl sugar amidotransferase [Planctomycetaceae bacterium]|nr:N-acetyl sugar amidotransferase [Planctomycetaceae bacterium]